MLLVLVFLSLIFLSPAQLAGVATTGVTVLSQQLPVAQVASDGTTALTGGETRAVTRSCVCQLGRWAVLVGGSDSRAFRAVTGGENTVKASNHIAVYDLRDDKWAYPATDAAAASSTKLTGRRRFHSCAAVWLNATSPACVVVGGAAQTCADDATACTTADTLDTAAGTIALDTVEIVRINNADGSVTSVSAGPRYGGANARKARGLSCQGVGEVAYCGGGILGEDAATPAAALAASAAVYYWNASNSAATQWTVGPTAGLGASVYFPEGGQYSTVDSQSRVWWCGGLVADTTNLIRNTRCFVLNTTNPTGAVTTVDTLKPRYHSFLTRTGGPAPRVAVLGGVEVPDAAPGTIPFAEYRQLNIYQEQGTGAAAAFIPVPVEDDNNLVLFSDATVAGRSGLNLATQTPFFFKHPTTAADQRDQHWDAVGSGAASVYSTAVFFGGVSWNNNEPQRTVTVVDLHTPANATFKVFSLVTAVSHSVVASYQNKAFLLSGVTATAGEHERTFVHALYFFCAGETAGGYDAWDSTTGSCVTECYQGYYGASCAACNCTNAALNVTTGLCSDGVDGTGACTCNRGYYGTACHSGNGEVCSGNGVIDPSVNSTGACTCFPTFWGADCAGTCDSCTNGVCNDGADGDGVCECLPGFFGDACTACDCGTGACHSGLTATGECVCEPGTWGVNCQGVCGVPTDEATEFDAEGCPPVALDEEFVLTFRCDDGAAGTGHCVPLYSSAVVSVQSLVILLLSCLALLY